MQPTVFRLISNTHATAAELFKDAVEQRVLPISEALCQSSGDEGIVARASATFKQ